MNALSIRTALALAVLVACAGCGTHATLTEQAPEQASFEDIRIDGALPMPPNLPAPANAPFGPSSARIEHAVPYTFSLGHCGLLSPVDVDGSFWNPVDGVTPAGQPLDLETDAEMINATAGVIVVIGDEARFRTETGSVIRFTRHEGDKEFPACA